MKKNVKGYYFIIDAVFASILLIAGLVAFSEYVVYKHDVSVQERTSRDLMNVLSTLKISDFNSTNANDPWIVSEITSGGISFQENSILQQVGEYWAKNESDKARQLLNTIIGNLSLSANVEIVVLSASRSQSDDVFSRYSDATGDNVVATRRMVSGVDKGSPVEGFTSAAYLQKAANLKYFSYIYLGGFIGQGNITLLSDPLPSDFDSTKFNEMKMNLDPESDFVLSVNDNYCGRFNSTPQNLSASSWDISSCGGFLHSGTNNFSMNFLGTINNSYISGGYIRIDYTTNELSAPTVGLKTQYIPGLKGFINLYDSFYVPGRLNNLSVYLHFRNNLSTYMTIGGVSVFSSVGSNVTQSILLTDQNFSMLNYSLFTNKTVPFRISGINLTAGGRIVLGEADVVLITDISGSMEDKIGYTDGSNGIVRACNSTDLYKNDTQRLSLAKCLDKSFVEIIMNVTGNRVWLVRFSTNAYNYTSNNLTRLLNHIDSYALADYTCVSCAVNSAHRQLNYSFNSTRKKYIIVMSDGLANYCYYTSSGNCRIGDESTITSSGFDTSGNDGGCSSNCGASLNSPCINMSIYAANRSRKMLNAKVFTIGFGPMANCVAGNYTLAKMAQEGNGTYYASADPTELQNIYTTLAEEIARVSQVSQGVGIEGFVEGGELYPDSYIHVNYTTESEFEQYQILINAQTPNFNNCSFNYTFPNKTKVIDAKILSQSGIHWNHLLKVNGSTVFNLSTYGKDYFRLGDPFVISIPVNKLNPVGESTSFYIETGDGPNNFTGCSQNTTLVYTLAVDNIVARTGVLSQSKGCRWLIESEDGSNYYVNVPANLTSPIQNCSYTNASISYDTTDAYSVAVHSLLKKLDFDDDGKLDINLIIEDIDLSVTKVVSVPYMWGPSFIEARVWE